MSVNITFHCACYIDRAWFIIFLNSLTNTLTFSLLVFCAEIGGCYFHILVLLFFCTVIVSPDLKHRLPFRKSDTSSSCGTLSSLGKRMKVNCLRYPRCLEVFIENIYKLYRRLLAFPDQISFPVVCLTSIQPFVDYYCLSVLMFSMIS